MEFLDLYKVSSPLHALKRDGKIVLKVTGGLSFTKRAYTEPLLVLQTTESLGIGTGGLLVTLVGYGSKILDVRNLKRTPLIMMGLSAQAAGLLLKELRELHNDPSKS